MKGITPFLVLLLWTHTGLAMESAPLPEADPGALLREAEENSPAIGAARARLDAARHAPSQAEAPPDPEVSVAYTNDGLSRFTLGESEFSILALSWTQEIRAFGKRKQAGKLSGSLSETAEKDVERVRLQVLSQVKIAYADLIRLDRTADILHETRGVLESFEQTARSRYEVGQGIQESVLKAQTEIVKLEAEAARVEQERQEVVARLNAAVGRAADTPVGPATTPLRGGLPEDTVSLMDAAVTGSPQIGALEALVRGTEASVDLARLDLKPDFIWSASYQYRGDLDPMVMGMFGVRLPLYKDRKQAQAVAQAESELAATRKELVDLQIRTRSAVRELVARAQRAERLLLLYDKGILPQAGTTLESARASYTVGRIGFLDLLSDLKVLLDARRDRVSLEADRTQALAALEPLLGRELLEAPGEGGAVGGSHASLP